MKKPYLFFGLSLFLSSAAFAENPPSYQIDPSWLGCGRDADCNAVVDDYCHRVHVVNSNHLNDWNTLNENTTRRLQAQPIPDYCGKPDQVFPALKDGYAGCQTGVCVFHNLKDPADGSSQ